MRTRVGAGKRTQHRPDARKLLTRSFGWYSDKSRGMRAKADGEHRHAAEIDQQHTPRPHLARRRWAALIQRVYEVDPLTWRRCGGQMRIVSFIEPSELDVIQKIHRHCRLWEQSSRAPPQGRGHEQALGELRYESGLEFVDEPGSRRADLDRGLSATARGRPGLGIRAPGICRSSMARAGHHI